MEVSMNTKKCVSRYALWCDNIKQRCHVAQGGLCGCFGDSEGAAREMCDFSPVYTSHMVTLNDVSDPLPQSFVGSS